MVLAAVLPYFPFQDLPNHVARYALLAAGWAGNGPPWAVTRILPTGYIGIDLVGVALVRLGGPVVAAKILAILPLVILPGGFYALLRAAAPAHRGWGIAAAILSLSWFYMTGALNYCLGLGLAFLWLAYWWPRRSLAIPRERAVLVAGILGLFLVHLSSPLIVLVVVWIDAGLAIFTRSGEATPRIKTLLWVTTATGVIWGGVEWLNHTVQTISYPPVFRALGNKLLAMAAPFYELSPLQLAVTLGAYGVAVATYLRRARSQGWTHSVFLVATTAFLVLFFISPKRAAGAGDVDTRWLMPAYLLLFLALPAPPPSRRVVLAMLVASMASTLVLGAYALGINRQLRDYDTLLRELPSPARLLPLVTDQHRYGRMEPLLHHALWETARRGSRVAGLFAGNAARADDASIPHLNHLRVRTHVYYPPLAWGVDSFEPLDCAAIRRDFDFVVQAGMDERAQRGIERCATLFLRQGEFSAYRVSGNP